MTDFLKKLHEQRWDDHRYYHQSRINQSLHFVSAVSFLIAYATLFKNPAWAALIAWLVSMCTRQAGHFFFEPRGYDVVNQVTDDYKEEIKVGYNMRRKAVLLAVWFAMPFALWIDPSFLGVFSNPQAGVADFAERLGWLWFAVGIGALLWRATQLILFKSTETALVWLTKIATDPFHDIVLYWRAPMALARGEMLDPGHAATPGHVAK